MVSRVIARVHWEKSTHIRAANLSRRTTGATGRGLWGGADDWRCRRWSMRAALTRPFGTPPCRKQKEEDNSLRKPPLLSPYRERA